MWYAALNIFFFVFHTVFTLFNLTGWAFRRTRKAHLVTMLLTAFSWFVMGAWYGWGYCFCTDWHWQVREALGYRDREDSYIRFLLVKLTGWRPDPALVDKVVMIVFLCCLVLTLFLNIRDRRKGKINN